MPHDKEKVAVYGQGIIGSRCAQRLAANAYEVTTWNRTPKAEALNPSSSPSEAAERAGVLLFYLKDGPAVAEVFSQVRPSLRPEHVLINHSTVDLDTTHWLSKQCDEIGCGFLDAPFTGSKEASAKGELVYYVGGSAILLDRMGTLLDTTAKQVLHLGKVGDATIIKIVTNLISAATVQALAEANALSTRLGLPTGLLRQAIVANACGSPLTAMKLENFEKQDFSTHFSLENMRKDSGLARQLAARTETQIPLTDTTYSCLEALCQQGLGELDYGALAKAYDH